MFPNLYFGSLKYKIAAVSFEIYVFGWANTLPQKEMVRNFAWFYVFFSDGNRYDSWWGRYVKQVYAGKFGIQIILTYAIIFKSWSIT